MHVDAFELFCAYHLGITAENTYAFQNGHQVAERFGVSLDELQDALAAHGLDSDTLVHGGFDLASAQADVQLSPPGVDLRVLARMHFEELKASTGERDWARELADDAAKNRETFEQD